MPHTSHRWVPNRLASMSTRFVAIGDSFTEGVGDDDSAHPNGLRGWADRVAEQLAVSDPASTYANLAVRGRLLPDVLSAQLEPAVGTRPEPGDALCGW